MILLIPIVLYIVYINIATYRAFAADKRFAINKEQRTPEDELLRYARRGGWVGAKLAQHKLRHKSYKQPFGSQLNIIGMVQATSAILFALILSALALVPTGSDLIIPAQTAPQAAALPQVVPPADGQLRISLRPPAARPATW